MSSYQFVQTSKLTVGYLEWNAAGKRTAVLMHGWPDSPETWRIVAHTLVAAGFRVLAPALRGFAPTRFSDATSVRSGQLSAIGRDLLEFIDALRIVDPVLVGHDWGARAAANACGLRADVASHLVLLSVGYGTNDPNQSISLLQARNYWYHWLLATPRGEQLIREERRAFTREMWDTWAPGKWYPAEAFEEAYNAFIGPDWADVVLHSYRHRWGFAEGDPQYDDDEARLNPPPVLSLPTLVLHGGADTCNHPETSAGRAHFFAGAYERVVFDAVGHFPQREAPARVAHEILRFISQYS
ncbi:alpha/beta hydrolase [Pandoraea captiosa]|uniref:Alpha/beta hydrolase n=1 Tax=Pandoraea captiosa TaxID=2508302 RepID=A0A5E4ZGR5_9BURK|nr:alpha/beta hydrolase [Pandoraea captiosa]VVE60581.1 alpha/beta hydrolase [Pandoraea captiosa]